MQIYPKRTGAVSSDAPQSARSIEAADRLTVGQTVPTASSADRSDKVQISDAGRALAARDSERAIATSIEPERAQQIRGRVLSGAYDALDVVDTVARRLLSSGDL